MPSTRLKYKNAVIDESGQPTTVVIKYGDAVVGNATPGQTKTLRCSGKLMRSAVQIGTRILRVENKHMESDISVEVDDLIRLTVPSVTGTYEWSGEAITPTISSDYDQTKMSASGDLSATNIGTYTITFRILDKDNYAWSDGTQEDKPVTWEIGKKRYAIPTLSGSYQYDKSEQTPTVTNFVANAMSKSGDEVKTNAGSYILLVNLTDTTHTEWNNGTIAQIELPWTIAPKPITIPSLSGTYTYDGGTKNVTVNNFETEWMEQSGDASAVNAGTYTVYWDLLDTVNTHWSDSTTTQKSKTWTINKSSALKVSVSPTSHSWDADGDYSFTITNPSGGALSASSSATSYFTVPSGTLTSTTLVVTAKGRSSSKHTGTITITSAETDNYNSSTCTIDCTLTATCVSGDTLVTLADWSKKRLDELTYDDEVLVWNFFTGAYDTAKPMMIFYHGDSDDYLDLRFSDETQLKVVWSHELFDLDLMKWVEVSKENVADYIGHRFAKATENGVEPVELVSGAVVDEPVTSYSAQTQEHANLILGDMFTFTVQEYEGMYDLFSVDDEMKYNAEEMASDIETYGLYAPDDFAAYGLNEQMFYAAGGPYFKILVGRGVLTFEQVVKLIQDYLIEISKNEFVKKK